MLFAGGASSGGGGGLMSAQITLGGTTYTYTESGGTNLGTYTGQNFSVKITQGHSASPIPNYSVWFLQDQGTSRQEAWFINYSSGNLTSATIPIPPANTATNLGSHTIQIFVGGVLQTGGFIGPTPVASSPAWSAGTITATNHWFASEWRWQSALRPILNTPSTIVSNGWMLDFGLTGNSGSIDSHSVDNSSCVYASPMDTAGLTQNMNQTGNVAEIGLIPMFNAQWMFDPSGNHGVTTEFAMRSQAEASHSIPESFRDDATNAPVNNVTYPTLNNHYNSGYVGPSPAILNPQFSAAGTSSNWVISNSHFPALSYTYFCATGGDPWGLLGVIFEGQGTLLSLGINDGTYPLVDREQDRSCGWQNRSIAMAWAALKIAEGWGTLPSFVGYSSTDWKNIAQANIDQFYALYTNNSSTNYSQVLHSGALLEGQETWETAYITMSFYWHKKVAAALGVTFANLTSNFNYKAQGTIDRCAGTTAWPQAFPNPYAWLWVDPNYTTANFWDPPGPIAQAHYPSGQAEAWRNFWQGLTSEFNGYLDPSTYASSGYATLTVTSLNTGARIYNVLLNGGSSKLETDVFLPGWPLNALITASGLTGSGGTGTYKVTPDQQIGGANSWSIPTASPCNANLAGQNVGMAVNQKFRWVTTGTLPAPLSTTTDYYVTQVNVDNSIQFSDTMGGSPIGVTGVRGDAVFVIPYIGSAGSPVAMSLGSAGDNICMKVVNALAIDPTNGGFYAQTNGDDSTQYLNIEMMAAACAADAGLTNGATAWSNLNTMVGHLGAILQYRWTLAKTW